MGSLGVGGFAVAGAVGVSRTTTGLLYTVPANSWVLIQLFHDGGGSAEVTFGTFKAWTTNIIPNSYAVGPGQAIEVASISAGTVRLTGVLFTNT